MLRSEITSLQEAKSGIERQLQQALLEARKKNEQTETRFLKENASLREQLSRIAKEKNNKESQLRAELAKIEREKSQAESTLLAENAELRSQLARAEKVGAVKEGEWRDSVASLEKEKSKTESQLLVENAALREKLSSLEQTTAALKNQLQQVPRGSLSVRSASTAERQASSEEVITSLRSQLQALESKKGEKERELEREIGTLKDTIASLRTQIEGQMRTAQPAKETQKVETTDDWRRRLKEELERRRQAIQDIQRRTATGSSSQEMLSEDMQNVLKKAEMHIMQGRYRDASQELENVISSNPDNQEALRRLEYIRLRSGR